ncbi:hypothetical protein [Streptomyces sp. Go-475]|uniref:hypothetical protein n=1 Tax=Streptomyces sp. Go-475 TaxID=2072505 RepID=UPI000DF0C6BD|nr:hypothetical protein [Streptomyces sp. Go-475]AXE85934.1 hypothetical protein C1703_13055 [Streptomyces sp. Go-475]
MTARNDDARHDGDAYDGGEPGREAYDGEAYDGEAYDGDAYDGGAYDGLDPLMAVLVGDPLPSAARRDAGFMAAHRAAAADVALLREQLGLIGDTLARQAGADPSAVTPLSVRPRPGPRTRPRPLVLALRGLAAAAVATAVVGLGWVVVQSGAGAGNDTASSSAADSGARAESGAGYGAEEGKLSEAGYLACARLVVEGTVAEVEAVPGTGRNRVTLDVDRHYKPAEGRDRVVFPMDAGIDPPLRPGDHVLVGIRQGHAEPDLWTTDEQEIARERAWITAALPESRTYPCEE